MNPVPSRPLATMLVVVSVTISVAYALYTVIGTRLNTLIGVSQNDPLPLPDDNAVEYAMTETDAIRNTYFVDRHAPANLERLWLPKQIRAQSRVFGDLAKYDKLAELHLESAYIDDSALYGTYLLHLKQLYLNGSFGFTPQGLANLHRQTDLETLSLSHCALDDRYLEPIGRLRFIRELDLRSTDITDAGLAYLSDLQYLEVIYLNDTAVTHFGLNELKDLRSIRAIHVDSVDTKYLHDRLRYKVWNRRTNVR